MTGLVGHVLSVDVVSAGVDLLEDAAVDATELVGVDAFDVPAGGGVLQLPDGSVVDYVSADHDEDTVQLASPLAVALSEGDRLLVRPVRSFTRVTVQLSDEGEVVPARVPHTMQPAMPVGVRDEDVDRETVTVEERDGRFWLVDVLGRPPLEVWGDPLGVATEMRPEGLSAWTVGPEGRYLASRFGSGDDRLGVFNAGGQIVGGVTADGALVGQSGVVAGDLSVGGVPLMGRLWDNSPGAPQGWMERFSSGAVVNAPFPDSAPERPHAELWGYAKVGFTARAGRAYKIRVEQQFDQITSGSIFTRLVYTTDGSEPTINTTGQLGQPFRSDVGFTVVVERFLTSPVDAPVVVLVVNNSTVQAHRVLRGMFTVEDIGPQGAYGGGTYTTGRETTPPPTVREFSSTWTATDFAVYDESEQPVVSAEHPRQYGDPTGRRDYSAIEFTGAATAGADIGATVTSALTGSTLTKAEVFLANTSWGGGNDGFIALGKGGYASLPLTLAPQATVNHRTPTGAGVWVEVPVSWFNDSNRVVTLGDVDGGVQGGWFMNPTDEFPPQIRLTYTR